MYPTNQIPQLSGNTGVNGNQSGNGNTNQAPNTVPINTGNQLPSAPLRDSGVLRLTLEKQLKGNGLDKMDPEVIKTGKRPRALKGDTDLGVVTGTGTTGVGGGVTFNVDTHNNLDDKGKGKIDWTIPISKDNNRNYNTNDIGGILSLVNDSYTTFHSVKEGLKLRKEQNTVKNEVRNNARTAQNFNSAYSEYKTTSDPEKKKAALDIMQSTYAELTEFAINREKKTENSRLRHERRLKNVTSPMSLINDGFKAPNYLKAIESVNLQLVSNFGHWVVPIGGTVISTVDLAKSIAGMVNAHHIRNDAKKFLANLDDAVAATGLKIGQSRHIDDQTKSELLSLYGNLAGHFRKTQEHTIRDMNVKETESGIGGIGGTVGAGLGLTVAIVGATSPAGLVLTPIGLAIAGVITVGTTVTGAYKNIKASKSARQNAQWLNEVGSHRFGNDRNSDIALSTSNRHAALLLLIGELGHDDGARRKIAKTFLKELGAPPELAKALELQAQDVDSEEKMAKMLATLTHLMNDGLRTEMSRIGGLDVRTSEAQTLISMLRSKDSEKRDLAFNLLKDCGATETQLRFWKHEEKDPVDEQRFHQEVAELLRNPGSTEQMKGLGRNSSRARAGSGPMMPHSLEFTISKLYSSDGQEKAYAIESLKRTLVQGGMPAKSAMQTIRVWLASNDETTVRQQINEHLTVERHRSELDEKRDWHKVLNMLLSDEPLEVKGALKFLESFVRTDLPAMKNLLGQKAVGKLQRNIDDTIRSFNKQDGHFSDHIRHLRLPLATALTRGELQKRATPGRMIELLHSDAKAERIAAREEIARRMYDLGYGAKAIREKIAALEDSTDTQQDKERAVEELAAVLHARPGNFTALHSAEWVERNLRMHKSRVLDFLSTLDLGGRSPNDVMATWIKPEKLDGFEEANVGVIKDDLTHQGHRLTMEARKRGTEILDELRTRETRQDAERILEKLVPESKTGQNPLRDRMNIWNMDGLSAADKKRIGQEIEILIGTRKDFTVVPTPDFSIRLLRSKHTYKRSYAMQALKPIVISTGRGEALQASPYLFGLVKKLKGTNLLERAAAEREIKSMLETEQHRLKYERQFNAQALFDDWRSPTLDPNKREALRLVLTSRGASDSQLALWRESGRLGSLSLTQDNKCYVEEIKGLLGLQKTIDGPQQKSEKLHTKEWYKKTLADPDHHQVAAESLKELGVDPKTIGHWQTTLQGTDPQAKDSVEVQIDTFLSLKRIERPFWKPTEDLRKKTTGDKIQRALNDDGPHKKDKEEGVRIFVASLADDKKDEKVSRKIVRNLKSQIREYNALPDELKKATWMSDYVEFQLGLKDKEKCHLPSAGLMTHMVDTFAKAADSGRLILETDLCQKLPALFGVEPKDDSMWVNDLRREEISRRHSETDVEERFRQKIETYLSLMRPDERTVGKKLLGALKRTFRTDDGKQISRVAEALGGNGRKRAAAELVLKQWGATSKQIRKWRFPETNYPGGNAKTQIHAEIYNCRWQHENALSEIERKAKQPLVDNTNSGQQNLDVVPGDQVTNNPPHPNVPQQGSNSNVSGGQVPVWDRDEQEKAALSDALKKILPSHEIQRLLHEAYDTTASDRDRVLARFVIQIHLSKANVATDIMSVREKLIVAGASPDVADHLLQSNSDKDELTVRKLLDVYNEKLN